MMLDDIDWASQRGAVLHLILLNWWHFPADYCIFFQSSLVWGCFTCWWFQIWYSQLAKLIEALQAGGLWIAASYLDHKRIGKVKRCGWCLSPKNKVSVQSTFNSLPTFFVLLIFYSYISENFLLTDEFETDMNCYIRIINCKSCNIPENINPSQYPIVFEIFQCINSNKWLSVKKLIIIKKF